MVAEGQQFQFTQKNNFVKILVEIGTNDVNLLPVAQA